MYRLISLLGAVLFPIVGLMHKASMGISLAFSGLFAGLLGGSYVSKRIRRHYVGLVWGMFYLTTAWITTLTALNHFSGTYSAVFLSAYALFGGGVALGSDSARPILYYLAAGVLFAGGALLGAQAFQTSPLMLIGGMVVVAILESGAALWTFSTREQMAGQDGLFGRAQGMSNVGVWEYDLDSDAFRCTPQVYRICDRAPDDTLTLEDALSFFPPDDRATLKDASTQTITKNQPYNLELRLTTEEGNERWVRARGEPEQEDGEVVRVRGTLRDITEQKEREHTLRAEREEAKAASRAKSTFLTNVSQEIRTPLTAIIGFAEAVAEEAETIELSEDTSIGHHSSLIEKSGKHLLNTLEGVLNLSKLKVGQMKWRMRSVDLSEQAWEIAEEFQNKAEEKEIDLRVEIEDEVPRARADVGGVSIMLQNLVSNAIKYTPGGGTVWVRVSRKGDWATVEVEDTGIGMEQETVEQIFEPFQQVSKGLTREYDGSGVGLIVTRKVIEGMNGNLEIETEPGNGSRFTIQLPVIAKRRTSDDRALLDTQSVQTET
jgi:signal transduction histidine kinase